MKAWLLSASVLVAAACDWWCACSWNAGEYTVGLNLERP